MHDIGRLDMRQHGGRQRIAVRSKIANPRDRNSLHRVARREPRRRAVEHPIEGDDAGVAAGRPLLAAEVEHHVLQPADRRRELPNDMDDPHARRPRAVATPNRNQVRPAVLIENTEAFTLSDTVR